MLKIIFLLLLLNYLRLDVFKEEINYTIIFYISYLFYLLLEDLIKGKH